LLVSTVVWSIVIVVMSSVQAIGDSQPLTSVLGRFFAGLGIDETAKVLEVSRRSVQREWSFARAWLFRELQEEAD
jgi:hypothetical protein